MSIKGFIKLDRAIENWRYSTKPNYVALWVYLLVKANHEKRMTYEVEVDRGCLLTSYEKLAKGTGLSVQNVRTILKHLNGDEITCTSTNKNTLIRIIKYDFYQGANKQTNKRSNNQLTSNQQTTNNKQDIKETKSIEEYITLGDYGNVKMTNEQLEKLKAEFPKDWQMWIDKVDIYCQSKGVKYKDYLATIRRWSKTDKSKDKPKEEELKSSERYAVPW